jgi:type I restriction enzyme, S subunit
LKLGEILTLDKDNTIIIDDDTKYKIAGVQSYGKGILNKRRVLGKELTMRKYQVIKPNQLMWCKVDTKNGAFGITTTEHEGSLASTNMALASINQDKANPKFIQILFQNAFFIDYLNNLSTGTTNRKYIKVNDLISIVEIPSLSLSEQNEFVERYTLILKQNLLLEEELNTQYSLVKKLRGQVLQDAIQGKLVQQDENDEPASLLLDKIKLEKDQLIREKKIKKEKPLSQIPDEEKPFELPNRWEWVRLEDISQYIQRGKSPKYVEKSRVPVISQKCIQWNGFDIQKAKFINEDSLKAYQQERFIEYYDLLWNSTGLGTLGRINIFDLKEHSYDKIVVDSHVTVIRVFKEFINAKYLFYWFSGPLVQNEINNKSTGSTKQTELGLGTIKNYIVPLPPLEEQIRIVEKVEGLMVLCNNLQIIIEQSKQEAENLMKAVLQEAFTVKEEALS